MAIPADYFYLDPAFEGTLQQQIRAMVAEAVLSGRFRPGEKLPSSRGLAARLGVSRITVTLAYTDLVADDYLVSKGRSGFYVSPRAPRPRPALSPSAVQRETVDWQAAIVRPVAGTGLPDRPANWRDYPYPFIYGQPDPTLFDHANWRQCALRALGRRDFDAMAADAYDSDDPRLVEFIRRHTLPRRGIHAAEDEVLVTLGAQNALWMVARLLLGPDRAAVIEEPGHPGFRGVLAQTGCALHLAPVDGEGLDPARLPDAADAVFLTPSHHAPTSVTMPALRRRELLAWAERTRAIVVEDDYEFEMSALEPPVPALKGGDRTGRVVHVGSFSKSLFPGARLGYVVAPAPLIAQLRKLRATLLRHPPGHVQRTAAYFLSLGHYDALIRRTAEAYAGRRAAMENAIGKEGLTPAVRSHGGSSLWMRAPDGAEMSAVAQDLKRQGVLIEPGRPFFGAPDAPDIFYRIAYSSIAADRIPAGLSRVAAAIRARGTAG